MSLITQIKATKKAAQVELDRDKKRLAKAEKAAQAATQALAAANQELAAAKKQVDASNSSLAKVEEMLKGGGGDPAPRGKPGPKPKAEATGRKKPGPKPKAEKGTSRAAQGRREVASGKRPPIKDVIAKVLGGRVMHANQVYEAIKAKGQLPNSGDPRGYIGYLLSASKVTITKGGKETEVPLFERVHEKGRGFYKNRGVEVSTADAKPVKEPKATKPAKEPKAKAAPTAKKASGAPVVDGKRTVTCGKCGQTGHNSKGHDRAVAAKSNGASEHKSEAKPAKEPKAKPAKEPKAKPAKATAAPVKDGKRTVVCGKCGETGHNARGHDKAAAKTNGNGHSTSAAAKAAADEAKPKAKTPPKVKDESEKSTDEILAEAGIDAGGALG